MGKIETAGMIPAERIAEAAMGGGLIADISARGCLLTGAGAHFAVWAPEPQRMELFRAKDGSVTPMLRGEGGVWRLDVPGFAAGECYGFMPDGKGPFPDPASRFQPQGVHKLSQAVDLRGYPWRYPHPPLPPPARRSLYELHVGAFTPEGTFDAARLKLPALRDLGVNLIELMPLSDFPGNRDWGYTGVSMFAPARCYGSPKSVCAFIDAAHALGLCVLLDVVYNHFGPDGNYTGLFSKAYVNHEKHTPWGPALNFDGPDSQEVRRFLLANAAMWIREYRFDGLRLDATHAILDDSDPHFLAEVVQASRRAAQGRAILMYAEDERNLARVAMPIESGGYGFDGIWSDDLHHHLRRSIAGDRQGYYAEYDGSMAHIAETLMRGWFRDGSGRHAFRSGGSDPDPLGYARFVTCIQNHDQVGNRPFGERLHHQIRDDVYRALTALLLIAPETPLLFMGQEWACSAPFLFFTDHDKELGVLVTVGRRREFAKFFNFDEATLNSIPDPQEEKTFAASRLDWSEIEREPHASVFRLNRDLLALRGGHRALGSEIKGSMQVTPADESGVIMVRGGAEGGLVCAVCLSQSGGVFALPAPSFKPAATEGRSAAGSARTWRRLITTEDVDYATDPAPIAEEKADAGLRLRFARAGAWIGEA